MVVTARRTKHFRLAKKTMVTIRDVAGESQVSITTVSLVLNGGPSASRIPPRTRERILKVAKRLGYRPNVFARSLRSNRSQSLGVVVFDIADPYCAQILRGIENHLRVSGYFPILTDLQNNGAEFRRCVDVLFDRRVEGFIAIANPVYLGPELFAEFVRRRIPAVVIGRELTGSPISSIAVDNAAGTRLAIQHLYELGHSKIAFIKGPKEMVDTKQRWRGVEDFAREVGIKLNPKLVVNIKGRNSTYAEAHALTEELLKCGTEFTALLAFDDLTACAAIGALTKAGRQVPRDCSVVGFDDIPSSAFYNPPLTTVHQQLEMQGSLGAEIIEELIEASVQERVVEPKHRTVAPKLVVRNSTGPSLYP
jgi:LacI family transcriptional regulator